MKTHQITPPVLARRAGGAGPAASARLQAGSAVVPSEAAFGCPVCGAWLQVTRRLGEVAGMCPVCHSGVVAPQPELGCRAMTYRDWLRMQEFDCDARPPTATMVPRPSESLGAPQARAGRSPWGPVRWAAVGSLATVVGLGGWLGHRYLGTVARPSPAMVQTPNQRLGMTLPGAPAPVAAPAVAPSPSATATSAATLLGETSLAGVLNRPASTETKVVVEATQVHDFARSAPPTDGFLCLKLTDATATARVYAPRGEVVATTVETLLPWGSGRRVTAQVRWRQDDPATGVAGHWRLVSLEGAAAAVSSAR